MGRSEMTTDRNRKYQEMASRGKYHRRFRLLMADTDDSISA